MDIPFYDGQSTTPYKGVSGGHRTGKRKRGTSVTRQKPKTAVKVYLRDYFDSEGNIVALGVDMVSYKRPGE